MQKIFSRYYLQNSLKYKFSEKKQTFDQDSKISKRWSYLIKTSKQEQPLQVIHEQDQRKTQEIQEKYRFGFQHNELKEENIMIKNLLSINNASQSEILKYRINQAVQKYQRNINDTASPAVQVAVLSERLIQSMLHMENNQQDTKAARHLIMMLSQRRKALNYLKRDNYHIYRWIINDYGIIDNQYPNHKEKFHHVFYFKGLKRGGIKRTLHVR